MIEEKKTLIDYFPQWDEGNGIFSFISNIKKEELEWAWLVDNAIALDQEYFGLHAGNKPVSPLVERYIIDDTISEIATNAMRTDDTISEENLNKLARIIINRFGENWSKLAKIYGLEYNPIHNYDMHEVETPDIKRTKTGDKTSTETPEITRTRTPNLTDTETPNIINEEQLGEKIINSDNQNDSVYGFNSNSAVPTDMTVGQSSEQHSGTNINKETGTRTTVRSGNETETESGTKTINDNSSETETETGTRTLERKGNIGVTTTQAMIKQEIDIWNWNFIDTVFKNVDKILTLSIYY